MPMEQAARRTPVQLIVALTYRCGRSCPYCYAFESAREIGGDIDLARAERALDWALAQGAEVVSYTGGEPTCHPRFPALVEAARRRGLALYLNTNGLFGPAALEALSAEHIRNVGFHVSARRLHRPGELDRIAANLSALKARGVEVFARYTLYEAGGDGDLAWLMDFCRGLGVDRLNLALGFPGRGATNRFVPADQLAAARPVFFDALARAARAGIRVRLSKPAPLCLFTPAEFARFARHHELMSACSVHARGGVHNLVVNPDLSTYPCVGLPRRGPALDAAPDYAPQAAHCRAVIDRAQAAVQSACAGCAMRAEGYCQGACLGHCHAPAPARAVSP